MKIALLGAANSVHLARIANEILVKGYEVIVISLPNHIDNDKVTTLSIRSKDIIGKHTLYFFSNEEEIVISHSAISRDVFSKGILKAILFMDNKKPGFYTMEDIINEI